jgi:hypothetical protein
MLAKLRAGRSFTTISDSTGIPVSTLHGWFTHRTIPPAAGLQRVLRSLGADEQDIARALDLRQEAVRVARSTRATRPGQLRPVVAQGWDLDFPRTAEPSPESAPVEDLEGHPLKPDPLTASTPAELQKLLRAYWVWAGEPSPRDVARDSGGAFSHTTAYKLLDPNGPPFRRLKQVYVRGLIRGCGGDDTEQRLWVTSWRRIRIADE